MSEQNLRLIELLKQTGTVDEKTLQEKLKKAYYEGIAIITDEEYDSLFDVNAEDIGYRLDASHFDIIKHTEAMGSLSKIKTYEAAEQWLKEKCLDGQYVVQPKLDGLSMGLYYKDGILQHAVLRGSGIEGEDIKANALKFDGVKETIADTDITFVKGEIVISKSNFESLTDSEYSNRRNAVSGICRRHDGAYCEKLSFYTYGIETIKPIPTQNARMLRLYNAGFKVPFTLQHLAEDLYLKYADIRTSAEQFQMDGLVLKQNVINADDLKLSRPTTQIALKFPPEGEQTTITGFEWNVGSSGAVVPKYLFETVNVQGTNISKAAGGSAKAVIDFGADIGSLVLVQRMGDVIPKVTKLVSQPVAVKVPDVCPDCGYKLEWDGANLYCNNPNCIQKLKTSCGQVFWALEIKGVSSGFISELVEKQVLTAFPDVVMMKPEMISDNCKISQNRAIKIIDLMHSRLCSMSFKDMLYMFCITGVSGKAITKLDEYCSNDWNKFLSMTETDCIDVLGKAKGKSLFSYLSTQKNEIVQLLTNIVNIRANAKSTINPD